MILTENCRLGSYNKSDNYAVSVHENFIQNYPYLLLIPYMEIMMTHSVYFLFQRIAKPFFSFLLIWSACLSTMYSRKETIPNHIEFSKNQTSTERFARYQKFCKGKVYFEPCMQPGKKMSCGISNNPSKSILAKTKERGYQRIRMLLFLMVKTLDSKLYMKPKLAKDQELDICNRVFEIATYDMRIVCVTIEK